jgi:urease accessory protein UreH
LADNATLLYADVVTPGRTHRDEKFVFDRFANDLEVYRKGKLVVWDHYLLQPEIHQFDAIGAMEQFTHCGSFWIITEQPTDVLLQLIREAISKVDSNAVLAAASLTVDKSISVRMAVAATHSSDLGLVSREPAGLTRLPFAEIKKHPCSHL